MTKDYSATLSGMRDILERQTQLVVPWLHKVKRIEDYTDEFKSADPEVLRVIFAIIHVAGISAHSVLALTQDVSLRTRDCYPIARSVVESIINIVFIMARGVEAAELADRHAQQKAYRDLNRKSSAGGWSMTLGSSVKLSPEDEERLSALAAEFTTSRGREKRNWTKESLTERIDVAAQRFQKKPVLLLHAAMFNIYRHSSEVIHGTYFGAMHFWGLTTFGRSQPKSEDDLLQILSEHQFSLLMSIIFAYNALIECLGDYLDAPELGAHAKLEFDRFYELPLFKKRNG